MSKRMLSVPRADSHNCWHPEMYDFLHCEEGILEANLVPIQIFMFCNGALAKFLRRWNTPVIRNTGGEKCLLRGPRGMTVAED